MLVHSRGCFFSAIVASAIGVSAAAVAAPPSTSAPRDDDPTHESTASSADRAKLASLRHTIATHHLAYTVGLTAPAARDLRKLASAQSPSAGEMKSAKSHAQKARTALAIDRRAERDFRKKNPGLLAPAAATPQANAASLDWRTLGKVTRVRDQGDACASGWAFAVAAAFESSYLVRNGATLDVSEQEILSCSGGGSCAAGTLGPAMEWLVSDGVVAESARRYVGRDVACGAHRAETYRAVAYARVDPDKDAPDVETLKAAIAEHGPVVAHLFADEAFQHYTGGVFYVAPEPAGPSSTQSANHVVVIIGWDDAKNAWLVKNSWGTSWGDTCGAGNERGYAWVRYDSAYVGSFALWIAAAGEHVL